MVSSILPKNERKQFDLRYHSSKFEFFRSFFLGELKILQKDIRNYLTFTYSSTIILLVFYIFIHNTIHTTYKHEYLDFSHISIIYTMYALISNFCLYICKLSLKPIKNYTFVLYFSFLKPILWVKRTLCTIIHYHQ